MFKAENIVVVAGAGAGKTYTLVQEYLFSLLGLDGADEIRDPRKVLAVTFTDKAAKEMRERVVERLQGLLDDPDADFGVNERLKASGKSLPSQQVMRQLLRLLPKAQICTFHSFCANILRRFPVEAGVGASFDLLQPEDEAKILEKAAEAVVLRGLGGNSSPSPRPHFMRSTLSHEGRGKNPLEKLLVTFQLRRMGDAQGLIDMIVSLYHKLCEHGVDPARVHLANHINLGEGSISTHLQAIREEFREYDLPGVKLSGKAAEKLAAAEKAFAELEGILRSGDLSSRMREDSRSESTHITGPSGLDKNNQSSLSPRPNSHASDPLPRGERGGSPPSSEPAISHAFSKFRDTLKGRFGPDVLRKQVVLAASKLGSYLCDVHTLPEVSAIGELLAEFSRDVIERKKHLGGLGFGDLLMYAAKLLIENKAVRKRLKSDYKRILVDEFQDTSPLQEDLMALVAERVDKERDVPREGRVMGSVPLAENKLFIVGDPKQSIYGFRGADAQLFVHTLEVISKGNSKLSSTGSRKTLDLCRRSQGSVVDVVNLVAEDNISDGQDGVPFEDEDRLAALRETLPNAGAIWEDKIKEDKNHNQAIAEGIGSRIKAMVDGGSSPKDFAVLVRRISAGEAIRQSIQGHGISVKINGGAGYFTQQEVMDFICLLKLAVDPKNQLAIFSILRSPFLKLSDGEISELISGQADWSGGVHWRKVCDQKVDIFSNVEAVVFSIRQQLFRGEFGDILESILEESDYLENISGCEKFSQKIANIQKLKHLYVFDGQDHVTHINKLWECVQTNPKESLAPISGDLDCVQIMTIHQSKGLEFKNVILSDTYATIPSSKDIVAFDPDVGLALSHKGRPISVCAPGPTEKNDAPTAMDRVKNRVRKREEAELSRLLYVALTRARDKIFWTQAVDAEGKLHQSRGLSMDDLFQRAVAKNQNKFSKLMPMERGA